jgi:hypothetical protein
MLNITEGRIIKHSLRFAVHYIPFCYELYFVYLFKPYIPYSYQTCFVFCYILVLHFVW